jgi:hypothetical protein
MQAYAKIVYSGRANGELRLTILDLPIYSINSFTRFAHLPDQLVLFIDSLTHFLGLLQTCRFECQTVCSSNFLIISFFVWHLHRAFYQALYQYNVSTP